jgi:nicotinate dehydrogenase subunit B
MKRRTVLAGGVLVVAFAWRPAHAQSRNPRRGQAARRGAAPLPGSLQKQPLLDGWIRIGADGAITVFTGKAELGQGIRTALVQVAAEELVVAPQRIGLVTADTARTADEGYTAGSHSMQDSGTAIRHAAAHVRALLLGLAAQRLGVPAAQLALRDGVVSAGERHVAYGELVGDAAVQDRLHVPAPGPALLREPQAYTVIGRPLPRVDIPAKVSGGAAYVQDLRPDGMVHGRVLRPPGRGAQLLGIDTAAVERLPGVLKVVRDGRFIGVIAQREFQAVTALRALEAAARWSEERPTLPPADQLHALLLAAPARDLVILDRGSARPDGAPPRTVAATYTRPYQMHASIGPSCAIALCEGAAGAARYTVWTHSQGVFPLRRALAGLLRVRPPQVRCIHAEGSGCYGHNGADDAAADAALLARALPGRPVRVQWMREDEHAWEPLGPPMVARAQATLDAAGTIVQWHYEVWSPTHSTRPGGAGDLLAATHLAQPFAPTPPRPLPQPEGGGDRNAIPLYRLPAARVVHHFLPEMPLRVSALRSLGAYHNVFAIESFMDELARAAGADPVAFRLRHLDDVRAQQVVGMAAQRFGWDGFRRRRGLGRGFGFARYKNLAAYCAIACEVELLRDSGEVRLLRAVAAVDSGEVVNPDGLRNQIEGGMLQSASWTLLEEAGFDQVRITSRDWGGYPILRFTQVPARVDVHLVDRPGQPFLGSGEAAQGPMAAAIANAVADAGGVRLRDLPLSRARVRAALGV